MVALDAFFGHSRTGSLGDYLTMWKLCFEEACATSGLELNAVGRSYLLLRSSGLTERRKDDLLLHVAGDLGRHDEIVRLLSRISRAEGSNSSSSVPALAGQYYADPAEQAWYDQSWDTDDS